MSKPSFRFIAGSIIALSAFVGVFAQTITLTPHDETGIYELQEKAGWTVTVPAEVDLLERSHTYVLKKNNLEVLSSGVLEFQSGRGLIETSLDEPAMLHLEVIATGEKNSRVTAGAAVAPFQLRPSVPRPADFDAFWAAKLKHLETIHPEPQLTPRESGNPTVDYATVKLKNIQGSHVYGQIAKPAREGKFPAMLILQWAGGPYPLQKSWVTDRAAEGWLALNIEPHDVPGDMPPEFYEALPAMLKSYHVIGNDDRDRNYFLRMYLGAYRAADYLASHPNWNGKTLLVTGTSMGGQQSLAVTGLHSQITHLVVHVPAGADSNGALHGRAAGYPNWDVSNPKVRETALYFDTVNFASRIKVPSLVSMGFLDSVCPPVGIWIAFNQIAGPKEVVPLVNAAHNHESTAEQQKAYTDRANAWFAALLNGEQPSIAPSHP
jgi:cephalosporin-C deacetylase-like acetyl esterase